MKKVFIVHGFQGSPNGGWRPWLMAELERQDIYACALPMPTPDEPVCAEWVEEITRYVEQNVGDDIYLVGHSLGVPTILRYLESDQAREVAGMVLVSGPSEKNANRQLDSFLDKDFEWAKIKSNCRQAAIIHGSNDPLVPLGNAEHLFKELGGSLTVVENGGHLNGSAGWLQLPQCLEALEKMMG